MNSKQRILTALNNAQPDKVPIFEALIDEPIIIDLARLLGVDVQKPQAGPQTERGMLQAEVNPEILDLYCLLVKELGLDATCYEHSIGLEDIGDGHGRDKYGIVYRLSGHGDPMVMEGPIKEPADIVGYDMASMLEPHDFAPVEYVIDRVGEEKAHFVAIMGPFKVSWLLRGGMENLLMDYVLNPELVHGLARVATDFCMAAVDMAAGVGGDVILLEGDLAGEKTTLISPEHFREYVKSYQREIVDYAHQKELKIAKHTDGNAWLILDDFVEVGFDGFHPVQPQCMDIAEVKEHLAGKACILALPLTEPCKLHN